MTDPRKLLITPAELERAGLRGHATAPDVWGPWRLIASTYELEHARYGYRVDLERCTSSAEILDRVVQIAGKRWGDDSTVAYLVRAIDDLLHIQGSFCPGGADKRHTPAWIRGRVRGRGLRLEEPPRIRQRIR